MLVKRFQAHHDELGMYQQPIFVMIFSDHFC